jgi:hypothetical protein
MFIKHLFKMLILLSTSYLNVQVDASTHLNTDCMIFRHILSSCMPLLLTHSLENSRRLLACKPELCFCFASR